jgi:hypothetical protein
MITLKLLYVGFIIFDCYRNLLDLTKGKTADAGFLDKFYGEHKNEGRGTFSVGDFAHHPANLITVSEFVPLSRIHGIAVR